MLRASLSELMEDCSGGAGAGAAVFLVFMNFIVAVLGILASIHSLLGAGQRVHSVALGR